MTGDELITALQALSPEDRALPVVAHDGGYMGDRYEVFRVEHSSDSWYSLDFDVDTSGPSLQIKTY